MGRKIRLDRLLVERGVCDSRERAREWIAAGRVLVAGIPAVRPDAQIDVTREVSLVSDTHEWVSRGAHKLLGALDGLGVSAAGRVAADLGSSTGGFTEVLLSRGAARVYAIDVGANLLHWRLRTDPRVVVMEGVNARHLDALPEPPSLIVGDLSFISLALIFPAVRRLMADGGEAVLLVKPQFEVGRSDLASGGRVSSDAARSDAIARVAAEASRAGLRVIAGVDSALAGARARNLEHFLHVRADGEGARTPPGPW